MDNLSNHKVPAIREAIEAAGAERTVHGLWNAIGRIPHLYSPQEGANYSRSCGCDAI